MTTTTRSPGRNPLRGMSLLEVMLAASLGSFILAGVLSMFLFIGRSGANIANYAEMETEARTGLEYFAQDTRQASNLYWQSANSVILTVSGTQITYTYNSANGKFTRTNGASVTTLIDGVSSFSFSGYMITGATVDLTNLTNDSNRNAASNVTKQIQVYLKASRTSATVTSATNTVLSARYILRNKRVTT